MFVNQSYSCRNLCEFARRKFSFSFQYSIESVPDIHPLTNGHGADRATGLKPARHAWDLPPGQSARRGAPRKTNESVHDRSAVDPAIVRPADRRRLARPEGAMTESMFTPSDNAP